MDIKDWSDLKTAIEHLNKERKKLDDAVDLFHNELEEGLAKHQKILAAEERYKRERRVMQYMRKRHDRRRELLAKDVIDIDKQKQAANDRDRSLNIVQKNQEREQKKLDDLKASLSRKEENLKIREIRVETGVVKKKQDRSDDSAECIDLN